MCIRDRGAVDILNFLKIGCKSSVIQVIPIKTRTTGKLTRTYRCDTWHLIAFNIYNIDSIASITNKKIPYT